MNNEQVSLFLTDDNQMVLDGILALVAQDPTIKVVGHCDNGLDVLEEVQDIRPDVLVLDISLPGRNGLEVCGLIREKVPDTAIIMLSMNANEQCVIAALERGASGYLFKEAVSSEFCQAVHAVARGEMYFANGVSKAVLDKAAERA